MRLGFLVTARLKSSRLPLKLLLDLNGQSLIERVIRRARQVVGCDEVVVCTSHLHQDLPLARIARELGAECFHGDPEDVLRRLLAAAELYNFDYFLSVTGDNPLFSVHHADLISDLLRTEPTWDFVHTEDLPLGVNVSAIRVETLKVICEFKPVEDTEIWGHLLDRPDLLHVRKMQVGEEYRRPYRLTLDVAEDYRLFSRLFANFAPREKVSLLRAYRILDRDEDLASINRDVEQRDLSEGVREKIDRAFEHHRDELLVALGRK